MAKYTDEQIGVHAGWLYVHDNRIAADMLQSLLEERKERSKVEAQDDIANRLKVAARALIRERVVYAEDVETLVDVHRVLEDILKQRSNASSKGEISFDDGQLFWPEDDGEQFAESMHQLLMDMYDNGQIEDGHIVSVRRARYLPTVDVAVRIDADGDLDYTEHDSTTQSGNGED